MSWHDAQAYCDHYGYPPSTEAQWEYAARGAAAPTYRLGSAWDPQKCSNWDNKAPGGSTFPVGSLPAGASWCRALDTAGNVCEWCADWFPGDYHETSPELHPTGPENGSSRVLRGDSWSSEDPRVAQRIDPPVGAEGISFGFRVSVSVP